MLAMWKPKPSCGHHVERVMKVDGQHVGCSFLRQSFVITVVVVVLLSGSGQQAQTATPAYIQGNWVTPQSDQSAVTLVYPAAQTAGDLNVVVVGWNDGTAHVQS